MPATSSAGATHQPTDPEGARRSTTAAAARPSSTTDQPDHGQAPSEAGDERPPNTAEAAEPSANGVTASPDCSGV